jgi:superfamily II DNA or RNA helicase
MQRWGNSNDALEIENGVRCFVEWTKTGKLEIRVFPSHKIHAKIYIATPSTIARVQNVYHGTVITGSSNLTEAGLSENLEFNVQLTDPEDHDYALRRFEELWAQSVPVERTRETIIKIVEHDSPYASFTPYELYLKFLTEYFREELGRTTGSGTDCYPRGFKELKYQADAVDAAFSILKQYHGVFLADVVGLGKTYMAAMLALRLDGRCLVIAPPALLDRKNPGSWPNVFGDFLVRGYICESIGKLDALLKRDLSVFKYVFVDESHRFRTDDTIRYDQLAQICRGKGVILVSATPYNNAPQDILSQIGLFQKPRSSDIPNVRNLEQYFGALRKRLEGLDRIQHRNQYMSVMRDNAATIRENVLKYLMVRRTRGEVETYYGEDLKKNKVRFPRVSNPIPLFYGFNKAENDVFTCTLECITSKAFHYARYKPLSPEYYLGRHEQSLAQGQKNLATFMKILLVKRLESSFAAFRLSLDRFIASYDSMIKMVETGWIYTSDVYGMKIFEYLENGNDEAVQRLIDENKAERFPAKSFAPVFVEHLRSDIKALKSLRKTWEQVTRDPKWLKFKKILKTDDRLHNKKIIIFSEFAETAEYLARRITDEVDKRTVLFSGNTSEGVRERILDNFDPGATHPANDINVLVTTDVLAEGINLHRSNIVINYDIPWNPTRLMQRAGRVNRIGTEHKEIHIFNFFPSEEGNDEIALKEAAVAKIHAFISMLGSDARLLTEEEEIEHHGLFKRLNSKAGVTGEDSPENSELRYLSEIRAIKEQNSDLFKRIAGLPRKARSTRAVERPTIGLPIPGVLTYFRKGALDKFFVCGTAAGEPQELDFLAAAGVLKTTVNETLKNIPLNDFYTQLDRNKKSFATITSPATEHVEGASKIGPNEGYIIKRLRAREFRRGDEIPDEDRAFAALVRKLFEQGVIKQHTATKAKQALEKIENPAQVIAALRAAIPPEYLRQTDVMNTKEEEKPSEVILSSYLAE